MAKYKRKGCGPRALGSALKKNDPSNPYDQGVDETGKNIYGGRETREGGSNVGSGNTYFTGEDNPSDNKVMLGGNSTLGGYNRLWTFNKVDTKTGEKTPGPGTFAVPTAAQKDISDYYNAHNRMNDVRPPYTSTKNVSYKPTEQKTPTVEKPKQQTKTTTKKTKPSGKIAYGGTKTWAEGSKAAKASTGKSLNQLVAARKGLKKGSAEYNTIQNQINAALGSKKRHGTPAKKKGCSKKRR
jgi:hypothetical protein